MHHNRDGKRVMIPLGEAGYRISLRYRGESQAGETSGGPAGRNKWDSTYTPRGDGEEARILGAWVSTT